MKSIKLKWVRTGLVGTVSPKAPRGVPYILSYLRTFQQVIAQSPPKGFASQEGVRQLQIGMALDRIVTEHIEEIGAFDEALEEIQNRIDLLQRKAIQIQNNPGENIDTQIDTLRSEIEHAQAAIWDVTLPEDIELLLEDAAHKLLVDLLEETDFKMRTLAIRAMIDDVKFSPDVEVEKKQTK